MKLDWRRMENGLWVPLAKVDASSIGGEGIYFIWHGGAGPSVILIGRGKIGPALEHWQKDERILSYARHGTLYCTWVPVEKKRLNGIHHYLQLRFNPPCVQKGSESAARIPVNAPWD